MIDEAKDMVDKLDKNKDIHVKTSDEFRESLASFIIQQTKKIQEQDSALEAIQKEFLTMVQEHRVEPEELRKWFNAIQDSKANYARALLDIFRPTGQSSTPLLTPKQNEDEDKEASSDLSPAQMNAINKFTEIMNKYSAKEEHREDPIENPPAGDD